MALTTVKSDQIQTSVALAGSPTTTTQSASDNSTKVATTAYVETAVANLVASAPTALNTLDELAAALNDDASFSTTITNSIATKLPLAGGTLTGDLIIGAAGTSKVLQVKGTSNQDAFLGTYSAGISLQAARHPNTGTFSNTGVAASAINLNTANADSSITFWTSTTNNAVPTKQMTIDKNGQVGIGVTNPGQTLEIHNSNASDYTDFGLRGTGHKYVIGVGNASVSTVNDKWYLYDNDNTAFRMVVDTSGNVGIGTAAPGARLQVNTTSGIGQYIYNTTSAQAYINFGNSTTGVYPQNFASAGGLLVGVDSDETAIVWNGTATALRFGTSGTERMRITSTGEIVTGGLTSSTSQLHLYKADSTGGKLTLQSQVAANATAAITLMSRLADNSNKNLDIVAYRGNLGITGDAGYGNVGIGLSDPAHKLDVQAGANQFDLFRVGSSASDNSEVTIGYFDASAGNGIPGLIGASDFGGLIQGGEHGNLVLGIRDNDATDGIAILSGGGNFMSDSTYDTIVAKFRADGKVGIGTNAPSYQLEVRTGNNWGVVHSDGTRKVATYIDASGGNDGLYTINSMPLALGVGGAAKFWINTSGNVGIGTNSPAQTLAVLKNTNYNPPGLGASAGHFFFGKQDGSGAGSYGLIGGTAGTGNSWLQAQRIDGTATSYNLLLQPSGGRVGIGTTNPNVANLEIHSSNNDTYTPTAFLDKQHIRIKHPNAANNYGGIGFSNSAGNYEWFVGANQTSASPAIADFVIQGADSQSSGYRENMRISCAGLVTKPYNLFVDAYMSSAQTISSWTKVVYDQKTGTNNSGFNNSSGISRFTAPVAGKYLVSVTVKISTASIPYIYTGIWKNGSAYRYIHGANSITTGTDWTYGGSLIMYLAQSDYIEHWAYSNGSASLGAGVSRTSFSIYLLG